MNTYNKSENQMTFKAQNWNQVIFLRTYLSHTAIPETVTNLTEQYKDYLPKNFQKVSGTEYKASEKKDFPNIVTADSAGFDITVNWENGKEVLDRIKNGIKAEKESKEKTT